MGATRIAVDPTGNPWIVNSAHRIYHWNGKSWTGYPGAATDIGVGANGSAWVLGANSAGGNYSIYHWNGSGWTIVAGGAVRIAVDANGNPWIINSAHQIGSSSGRHRHTVATVMLRSLPELVGRRDAQGFRSVSKARHSSGVFLILVRSACLLGGPSIAGGRFGLMPVGRSVNPHILTCIGRGSVELSELRILMGRADSLLRPGTGCPIWSTISRRSSAGTDGAQSVTSERWDLAWDRNMAGRPRISPNDPNRSRQRCVVWFTIESGRTEFDLRTWRNKPLRTGVGSFVIEDT